MALSTGREAVFNNHAMSRVELHPIKHFFLKWLAKSEQCRTSCGLTFSISPWLDNQGVGLIIEAAPVLANYWLILEYLCHSMGQAKRRLRCQLKLDGRLSDAIPSSGP